MIDCKLMFLFDRAKGSFFYVEFIQAVVQIIGQDKVWYKAEWNTVTLWFEGYPMDAVIGRSVTFSCISVHSDFQEVSMDVVVTICRGVVV